MTSQNQIYIMLAIERAREAGFLHFAAALVEMLRAGSAATPKEENTL